MFGLAKLWILTVTLRSIWYQSSEDTDRHPLFFSSAEYIHPVLNTVPASFPFKDMTQLHIIQVLLQHLYTKMKDRKSVLEANDLSHLIVRLAH